MATQTVFPHIKRPIWKKPKNFWKQDSKILEGSKPRPLSNQFFVLDTLGHDIRSQAFLFVFLIVGKRTLKEIYLGDRKSTRLNSSHVKNSYAVFCLEKKKHQAVDEHPTSS